MSETLVPILAFSAAFLGVFGINSLLIDLMERSRRGMRRQLEEEFRKRRRNRPQQSVAARDLSQLAAMDPGENSSRGLYGRLTLLIEQAGLEISAATLLGIALAIAVVVGGGSALALDSWSIGAALGGISAAIPFVYVLWRRRQRLEKLLAQLPDAYDLMSRILRAGQTISQALQAVADEFSEPISVEFFYCIEQMNLGIPPDEALRALARRANLLEIKIFVLAVMVHRQTGGNLAELLDKLATVVRDRFRVRSMIRTFTAQGRFQAVVLLTLPFVMWFVLLFLRRDYAMMLTDYPMLPLGMLGSMVLGTLWIRRIINFDF